MGTTHVRVQGAEAEADGRRACGAAHGARGHAHQAAVRQALVGEGHHRGAGFAGGKCVLQI